MAKTPKELAKKSSPDQTTYEFLNQDARDLVVTTFAIRLDDRLIVAIEFKAYGWSDVFKLIAYCAQDHSFHGFNKMSIEELDSPDGFFTEDFRTGKLTPWVPSEDAKSPLGFDNDTCLCDGEGTYIMKVHLDTNHSSMFLTGQEVE
jgi:hypothetical protein